MEDSILKSTKKVLGVDPSYAAFDLDILMHINASFGVLYDLGIGPVDGFVVSDENATWTQLALPAHMLNMVRSYVYLKTRLLFDPPSTSFHLEALKEQIAQFEWRLSVNRENRLAAPLEGV